MWLEKLYELIWRRIGGEKWTTIIRREQKNYPLIFMLIFFGAGILLVKLCKTCWWQIIIGFGIGLAVGHLWL